MGILLNNVDRFSLKLFAKGGGGGGSSGKVDYPDYMKDIHEDWLDDIDAIITTTQAANPYTGATPYDPDTAVYAMLTYFHAFRALSAISSLGDLGDSLLIDIESQVTAHSNILSNDLETNVLPTFRRGMQDVNAVMSSAFVIGEAFILADRTRQIAKLQSDLEIQNSKLNVEADKIKLQAIKEEMEFNKLIVQFGIQINSSAIAAGVEEERIGMEYDVKDARWDLSTYKEAGNMLAAISGAAIQTEGDGPTPVQSALGGALSGAAVGMMAGGPVGAGIGGAIGLVGGLL